VPKLSTRAAKEKATGTTNAGQSEKRQLVNTFGTFIQKHISKSSGSKTLHREAIILHIPFVLLW